MAKKSSLSAVSTVSGKFWKPLPVPDVENHLQTEILGCCMGWICLGVVKVRFGVGCFEAVFR